MDGILASAHTWFLESYQQGPYGALIIRLVEGIKGEERLPVRIGEQTLGPYFPVAVGKESRCVTIVFEDVRAVLAYAEGYETEDSHFRADEGRFLQCVEGSSFRDFAVQHLNAVDDFRGEFSEWRVWTEEQVLQVLASVHPQVRLEEREPDFTIERGKTWFSN